jgi:UDP-glucose 4-epimerase
MSNILITGGAGFVGTQVSDALKNSGHEVTVVDRRIKTRIENIKYIEIDYLDYFLHNKIQYDTVIHLAADHLVEQSVTKPRSYYENNVIRIKTLLDIMSASGIKNIIFSSSGNVYGRQGKNGPLTEDLFYDPENPYASTKVAGELLIKDYSRAYGMKHVIFRYFNAAGADPNGRFGYTQRPATHVIPILCNKIIKQEHFTIYGNDYPTKDGTCVRDYIHVADLANAHVKAIDFLNGTANETFNIGCGSNGISVQELVSSAKKVLGVEPNFGFGPRRAGDPATLVADISKAQNLLDWSPKYNIDDIVRHAWNWEKKFDASQTGEV